MRTRDHRRTSVGANSSIRNLGITIVRDRCDFGVPQTSLPLTRVADSLTLHPVPQDIHVVRPERHRFAPAQATVGKQLDQLCTATHPLLHRIGQTQSPASQ